VVALLPEVAALLEVPLPFECGGSARGGFARGGAVAVPFPYEVAAPLVVLTAFEVVPAALVAAFALDAPVGGPARSGSVRAALLAPAAFPLVAALLVPEVAAFPLVVPVPPVVAVPVSVAQSVPKVPVR
jgi:hypothetical protein